MNDRTARWLAAYALCLGNLMIVLDTNIVNVALPAIQGDLGFTTAGLAWVLNAYMITYGGFLLLGGRLGDLLGNRRVFLGAVAAFTVASAACALAPAAGSLVVGRGIQGVTGAFVSAVALALIAGLFDDPRERAKAMGVFGFVMSGGGAIGAMLGGVLTGFLTWHWVFLVNVPLGLGVWIAGRRVLPRDPARAVGTRLDVPGAVLVTAALMMVVYAVVHGSEHGWSSPGSAGVLVLGLVVLAGFVVREARCTHPLMPLRAFRNRSLVGAAVVGGLWAASMFATAYLSSLYLQRVLGYGEAQVGLAFLPNCLLMAVASLRWSDRLVARFGTRRPLTAGLTLVAVGLALLGRAPADGSYLVDVLPAFVLVGAGAGIALSPVMLTGMSGSAPEDAGLASGLLNTSFSLGGALGLAVLVGIATTRTDALGGPTSVAALAGGFRWGYLAAAALALVAAGLAHVVLREAPVAEAEAEAEPVAA